MPPVKLAMRKDLISVLNAWMRMLFRVTVLFASKDFLKIKYVKHVLKEIAKNVVKMETTVSYAQKPIILNSVNVINANSLVTSV